MFDEDVMAILELQYLIIQELQEKLNRYPTREEVIKEIEDTLERQNKRNHLHIVPSQS